MRVATIGRPTASASHNAMPWDSSWECNAKTEARASCVSISVREAFAIISTEPVSPNAAVCRIKA